MSILMNHPTDRKYQFDGHHIMCRRIGVYLGKNNQPLYFSRYIEYIATYSAIYRYISFNLPSLGIHLWSLLKHSRITVHDHTETIQGEGGTWPRRTRAKYRHQVPRVRHARTCQGQAPEMMLPITNKLREYLNIYLRLRYVDNNYF